MRKCEVLTLPLFQLIPHFLIALDVIQHPDAFTARVWDRDSVNLSVIYNFSSRLRLITLLTLTVRVSTQPHIETFTARLGDIHKMILPKDMHHASSQHDVIRTSVHGVPCGLEHRQEGQDF